jgi:hypothetical protein
VEGDDPWSTTDSGNSVCLSCAGAVSFAMIHSGMEITGAFLLGFWLVALVYLVFLLARFGCRGILFVWRGMPRLEWR